MGGAPHLNLKGLMPSVIRCRRSQDWKAPLRFAGLKFKGNHHRGIDDARNIVRLLPWVFG
jgi:inhibitor of KinA sporulation pathway (predicted exonuclease)